MPVIKQTIETIKGDNKLANITKGINIGTTHDYDVVILDGKNEANPSDFFELG